MGEARGQKIFQSEKLELLRSLFATAEYPEVVELTANRCLSEILGVPQKSKMAFAEEGWNDSCNEHQHEPRRKQDYRNRKGDCGDDLLDQSTDGLDHAKAICGLNACPLKPVVEDRVFVGKQIESRGMLHDLDAHVAHVIFREQGVEVIADAADGTGHNRQREFQSNEIPETGGDWLVRGDHAVDSIDDQLAANPSNCQRQQRGNQAKENSPCDDRAPESHTIRRTTGTLRRAANRSRQLLRKVRRSGIG